MHKAVPLDCLDMCGQQVNCQLKVREAMTDLARRTVAAAQQLFGNASASAVRQAFIGRGIL